jgi:hypothetical protein
MSPTKSETASENMKKFEGCRIWRSSAKESSTTRLPATVRAEIRAMESTRRISGQARLGTTLSSVLLIGHGQAVVSADQALDGRSE